MKKNETYWIATFIAASIAVGILAILCGPAGLPVFSSGSTTWRNLLELRAMRAATGFIVGAALSTAGCALQTILRNPLADPYILGVSSGASVGAALVMATGLSITFPILLPTGSFIVAIAAVTMIMLIASRAGGTRLPQNLILTGVVTGSVLSSVLMLIITFSQSYTVQSITWWLLGNLQCSSWDMLAVCAVPILLGTGFLIAESNTLNALLLGSENAHNLGINTRIAVPLLIGTATLITACAVALSGIIGFAGLIVPHIVRRRTGANHRTLLPLCALGGGIFLVLCDTFGRVCIPPHEIPVGVITALTGGPFFLYLLTRKNNSSTI